MGQILSTDGSGAISWADVAAIADTDDQTLSLSGTDLTIADGNTVDLSSIDTDTDDQTLSLSGTDLTIEDGNTVDLSSLVSSSSDTMNILSDADGDTKILVEESTDEDHLRFYASGKEVITVTNDGEVSIGRSTETITTSIIESHETGSQSGDACGGCIYGDTWQSFTLEENETVESIELYFEGSQSNTNSITLDFALYEGQGTDSTVVYQASGITLSGFSSDAWVTIDVPDFVANSGKYTIYISESVHWYYSGGNGYSDGRSSSSNSNHDYLFRVNGLTYNDNYVKVTSSGLGGWRLRAAVRRWHQRAGTEHRR